MPDAKDPFLSDFQQKQDLISGTLWSKIAQYKERQRERQNK